MTYLFPHKLKKISGLIFYLSLIAGSILMFGYNGEIPSGIFTLKVPALIHDIEDTQGLLIKNNIIDELILILIIVSGIIHSFSREKIEDELISQFRLKALVWSLLINYTLLILSILLVYGLPFLEVMILHMVSILILFNLMFAWQLHQHYKSVSYEK